VVSPNSFCSAIEWTQLPKRGIGIPFVVLMIADEVRLGPSLNDKYGAIIAMLPCYKEGNVHRTCLPDLNHMPQADGRDAMSIKCNCVLSSSPIAIGQVISDNHGNETKPSRHTAKSKAKDAKTMTLIVAVIAHVLSIPQHPE
jgi:hypothetical protein